MTEQRMARIGIIVIVSAFWIGTFVGKAVAQEPDHGSLPPNASMEERCQSECHIQHCSGFVHCSELSGEKDRTACRERVNDDEKRCMKTCGAA